ncbi:ankyrin repeat domain-containing protein [Rahnella bruchi]|uniref:ankyrin repeat domain-containing protein n=1 Tax=Rahnella bruchi TaxID=1510573 RepID=UPI001FCA0140|nr:ankyrin repeat domain-containing protein [Rahnella bruchi]
MMSKSIVVLLIIIASLLVSCDDYERNFYLSSLAASPTTINGLKSRWEFCEKCLQNKKCKPKDALQCKTVMIPDRNHALEVAIGRGNTEAVYFLVNETKADVNGILGNYNGTPLMTAAYYGTKVHQEIAEFLISRGANVNSTRNSPPIDTALLISIWKNNTDFAIFLLKNGADPSLTFLGHKEGNACVRANVKKNMQLIPKIPGCCLFMSKRPDLNQSNFNICK